MEPNRTIVGYRATISFLDGFVLGLGFWLAGALVAGAAWWLCSNCWTGGGRQP